jgi:hypothetical protein
MEFLQVWSLRPGGVFSNELYTVSAGGANAFCHGPVTFKFIWDRDDAHPEPPPKTAIVKIETSATAWNGSGYGNANNGWASAIGPAVTMSASEYKVKSNPGESFTMTINPSASIGANGGFCSAQVKMTAFPVEVALTNITWFIPSETVQTEEEDPVAIEGPPWNGPPVALAPALPHILIGERTYATLSADPLAITSPFNWTITDNYFRAFSPSVPASTYAGPTFVQTDSASPLWSWNVATNKLCTATGSGQVQMPNNLYNPMVATVTDSFEVNVRRPEHSLQQLKVKRVASAYTEVINGLNMIGVSAGVECQQGAVFANSFPTGKYGFSQTITSSTRTPPPPGWTNPLLDCLDGGFPYPILKQEYLTTIDEAEYEDYPAHLFANGALPVTANDNFRLTVVFKANRLDAQWVPLVRTDWSWSGSTGGPYSGPTVGPWIQTTEHPSWTQVRY